jgi:hypothetical protein
MWSVLGGSAFFSTDYGRWLWTILSTTWAFARISQPQRFEPRYQRGWFDTENVCGPVGPVDPPLGESKSRSEVLLLSAPPLDLWYHSLHRR